MKTHHLNTTLFLLALLLLISACKYFQPIDTPGSQTEEPEVPATLGAGTAQFNYWIHKPFHPNNNTAVTFQSEISEPKGIKTIELHIYEYQLFLNEDELPSRKKRSGGQWGKIKSWDGNGQTEMTLSHRFPNGFPKHSQVEYIFKAIDVEGKVSERIAIFDAGTSPWPMDKILLYSASRAELSETFNLCLFPDVDFKKNWTSFLGDSRKLIFDGFHKSNVMSDQKERWSFYYTRQEADGLKIAQDFVDPDHYPDFMKGEVITGIDAFALLHKKPYSDGSYMYGNIHFLAQSVFTTESYNYGTAIHEMGHAVFQLSDEYNGCACFQPSEGFSNVFETQQTCIDFIKAQGMAHQHCHKIVGIDSERWYTPEQNVYFPTEQACFDYNKNNGFTEANCITFIDVHGVRTYRAEEGLCIMNDDGDAKIYPFQEACMTVVNDYYSRFGEELLVSGNRPEVLRENIFGYEPVVEIVMKENNGTWSASVEKITYGVPNKKNGKGNGAILSFLDNNKNTTYRLQVDRPGEGHFCGGNTQIKVKESGPSKCVISIPYSNGLKEVVVKNQVLGKNRTIKNGGEQRIDLSAGIRRALQRQ